jgi:2-dehydro-3-deoxygluconokinase
MNQMSDNDVGGRRGFACFGEILLRLSPPGKELLLQSNALTTYVGGAEANVAVSLAQFGHPATMVSAVPDGPLGNVCISKLRGSGVRTHAIRQLPGRLGLYFVAAGAGHRPTQVLYDRTGSAFANALPDLFDWKEILQGIRWLHLSGIVAAVSATAAETALGAVRMARSQGVLVSFDCNYRAKLWDRSRGEPRVILRALVAEADLLFAEERDMDLVLEQQDHDTAVSDRFSTVASRALAAFPHLKWIATTTRTQRNVDDHDIAAKLMSRDGLRTTRTYTMNAIVDRIGSGDAFAAGVLHGLESGFDEQAALDFAVAAACLKHSIPGDFNLSSIADVEELLRARGYAVRR